MDSALMHYGILGQKWGIRRYQNKDGTLTAAGKRRRAKQEQAAEKAARKAEQEERKRNDDAKKSDMRNAVTFRRLLSNDEIKQRIDRIKLEKELASLTESEISPGRKFIQDVLTESSKKALTSMAAGAMTYAAKAALEEKFDKKEFAAYVAPKPGKK